MKTINSELTLKLPIHFIFILFFALTSRGQNIITISGNGTSGYSGDGGPASAAVLNSPNCVYVDTHGNIYISDALNQRIRMINTCGIITTVAGNGTAGFAGDGGQATAAELNQPSSVIKDAAENIYIGDLYNHRIRKISSSGIISTFAGNGTAGFRGDGGQATAAEFHNPYGMCFDDSGNLYIADQYNHCIRKINTSNIISTYAGTGGSSGFSGDGGAASSAQICYPNYVLADHRGNLFIADNGNHCVRKVNTSGGISTVAGTGGWPGSAGDGGAATAATLDFPCGLKFDAAGNMYIAGNVENRVRRVNASGIISEVAGTGAGSYGGDGGAASAAYLNIPLDIAIDAWNNVLIEDNVNNRIRKVVVAPTSGSSIPGAIIGVDSICSGTSITLFDTTAGGTWSCSDSAIAAIGISTGVVSGVSTGSATITYSISGSCALGYVTHRIEVDSSPNAGTISASQSGICPGDTIQLHDLVLGGSWHSSSSYVADVLSDGQVVGRSAGSDSIFYTIVNACGTASAWTSVLVLGSSECNTAVTQSIEVRTATLNVFPDPNSGTFFIHLSSSESGSLPVIVSNMLGQKVLAFTMETNKDNREELNLTPGMYFLSAWFKGSWHNAKMLVQ